jgi:hypothetical protein
MMDFQSLTDEIVMPGIINTVFNKPWEEFKLVGTEDTEADIQDGSTISQKIITSVSSPVRAHVRGDVDPTAGSFVDTKAVWDKIYQETALEVHNIDISEARKGRGIQGVTDLLTKAVELEMPNLWEKIYTDVYGQWKLDLTASGTYSDAALNRTTYPTLACAGYEATNGAITLAYMRACMYTTRLNKKCGPKSGYEIVMDPVVYNVFKPLVAALHQYPVNPAPSASNMGYQDIDSFEGSQLVSPTGMTVGDVFYCRKQDMRIQMHRPLEWRVVPSGADSIKIVYEIGVNGYAINPGFNALMVTKD